MNMIFYYVVLGGTFTLVLPQSLADAVVSPTITPLTTFSEESPAVGELVIDNLHRVQIGL
jgi:hypothetical protein